jgi:hypothetical protein
LIQPDQSSEYSNEDEQKHRFSPVICHGVMDGGRIVWATARQTYGTTGLLHRTDLPLNTAVGVPICSIGNDLFILVLFSVAANPISPDALEYLCTMANAVTMVSDGFLKPSVLSKVNTARFQKSNEMYDIMELIEKYSKEVDFYLLPMKMFQSLKDSQEYELLREFEMREMFADFKKKRDGRFTTKQIEALKKTNSENDSSKRNHRSNSFSSQNSQTWQFNSHNNNNAINDNSSTENHSTGIFNADFLSPDSTFDFFCNSNSSNNSSSESVVESCVQEDDDEKSQESFRTLNIKKFIDKNYNDINNNENKNCTTSNTNNLEKNIGKKFIQKSENKTNDACDETTFLNIYTKLNLKWNQCRLHEFMIAILGMTIFDCSELWLKNGVDNNLRLVSAVYGSRVMKKWVAFRLLLHYLLFCISFIYLLMIVILLLLIIIINIIINIISIITIIIIINFNTFINKFV